MPYEIYKVKGGYKVGKDGKKKMSSGRMYASDNPLNLETAKKQMAAMYASERQGKYRSFEFPRGYKVGRSDKKKLPNGHYYSTNKFLTKAEIKAEIKRLGEKYESD